MGHSRQSIQLWNKLMNFKSKRNTAKFVQLKRGAEIYDLNLPGEKQRVLILFCPGPRTMQEVRDWRYINIITGAVWHKVSRE